MNDAYKFRTYSIAPHMLAAIKRYVDSGIIPGDFLQAVISNNLKEAVGRADDENMANLPAFVAYFHNEVPFLCWGSKERMLDYSKNMMALDKIKEEEEYDDSKEEVDYES